MESTYRAKEGPERVWVLGIEIEPVFRRIEADIAE